MDPLLEYARHWLRAYVARIQRPLDMETLYRRVAAVEEARPGFGARLRTAALEAIGEAGTLAAAHGVAALAVVGEPEDRERLLELPPPLTRDARTAAFEIEQRLRGVP